jgi:nucleotide-binding universal stress UspA family protein
MKSILVATDFSPSADNAMNFAASMAKNLGASLTLLHVYQIPISMSDVPVLMVSAEELRNNADMGLMKSKEMLENNYPGLSIQTESRLGDVVTELQELCEKHQPLAVVVGKHGASGVERFFFGSTALSVIRAIKIPVITVPDSTKAYRLSGIALASDGSPLGEHESVIRNLILETGAKLHVIHVKESGSDQTAITNILQDLNPVCQTITSEDFIEGISNYLEKNQVDMLMVIPHKHSFIERFLFKTHTAELIRKVPYPVITLGEL